MKVSDAAAELGVSPRRVRALIAAGRLPAHKAGTEWKITDISAGTRTRRPLSPRSREMLGQALRDRSLGTLTGEERSRTASRIRELRTSDEPDQLLTDWWGGLAPDELTFTSSLVNHALAGDRDYLTETLRRRPREYLRRREDLADIVGSERAILGLSRRQLAEAAGVDANTVRMIERAEPVDSPSALRRVLRALQVEATALPVIDIS